MLQKALIGQALKQVGRQALARWRGGVVAGAGGVLVADMLDSLFDEETRAEMLGVLFSAMATYANAKWQLSLDPSDPLSDQSLTNAISARTGIPLRSVMDEKMLAEDAAKWAMLRASGEIAKRYGLELDPEDPFTPQSITNAVAARTGVPLTNLFDRAALEKDVKAYAFQRAAAELGTRTGVHLNPAEPFSQESLTQGISGLVGIPLRNVFDKDMIREDMIMASEAQIMGLIANKVTAMKTPDGQIRRVTDWVGKIRAGAKNMRVGEVRSLVGALRHTVAPEVANSKQARRRQQLRTAQAKYRAKMREWGYTQGYVKAQYTDGSGGG